MGGKGRQETHIKDPRTEPKGGRIEGGRWGGWGRGVWWRGKWRQLYLNNNKNKPINSKSSLKVMNKLNLRHKKKKKKGKKMDT